MSSVEKQIVYRDDDESVLSATVIGGNIYLRKTGDGFGDDDDALIIRGEDWYEFVKAVSDELINANRDKLAALTPNSKDSEE